MRTGWGFDVHPLDGQPPLILAGVVVSEILGVTATSDGDVLAHAVADALLGAAVLGDVGEHFPSDDPSSQGANSMELLARSVSLARDAGWQPGHVDTTVIAQAVRISPHRAAIRSSLAATLGLDVGAVSVKATTTDGLGLVGRGEGIAAVASLTVEPLS